MKRLQIEPLFMRGEKRILESLNANGYEAYFVGGCVRDALLKEWNAAENDMFQCGKMQGDVDVATNANPQQVKTVFEGLQTVDTGLKHGTVTVLLPGALEGGPRVPVEVTTYRSDGNYSDNRHPDEVRFVGSLTEDLERRDFTMNAIACDARGMLKDPFGGIQDIQRGVVKAVGDADLRFREDALRIMRALRFAAVLGFSIEEETEAALFREKHLLKNIAAERIYTELKKLAAGKNAGDIIRRYVDVLGVVIPELLVMKGFEQHNPYHKYDVLEHCIRAMEAVKTTPENLSYLKLAALFHDIGKPDTYFMDEKGIGHFYGHPARSAELVRKILRRLKADRFTVERIAVLVKHHDLLFQKDESLLKRWMNKLGPEVLREILEIKLADNFATGNMSAALADKFDDIREMIQEILAQEQCFSLRDLAIKGGDVIAAGINPGPEVGRILNVLLEAVIEEQCANEKEALLTLLAQVKE